MVYNQNANLTRLRDNSLVLRDASSDQRYQFSVDQLRLFSRFDEALRDDRIRGPGRIVPAGYDLFRTLWAQDAACPYQFAEYSPDTGLYVVEGQRLPIDELAPRRAPAPTPATASPSAPAARVENGFTPRQQAIVDDLIWSQLERNQRQQEFYRARREARRRARENEPQLADQDTGGRARRSEESGGRSAKKKRIAPATADPEPSNIGQGRDHDSDDDMDGLVLRFPDEVDERVEQAKEAKAVSAGA